MAKDLSLWFYIKSCFTFRFISNFAILVSILAYYFNLIEIFIIVIPLVIVNFIVINIIQIVNFDELMVGLLGKVLPDKRDRDKIAIEYTLINEIYHFVPVLWVMYILQSQEIVKIYRPNFMGTFLKSSIIPIIYYYFENKLEIYGKLNYFGYSIVYMSLLFLTCIYLYDK